MQNTNCPIGWSHNPSAWGYRMPVLILSLGGCGLATYLTLYQLDVLSSVWEPFFGQGSRRILKESAISHMLPIPDASLGAVAYLIEAVCELLGNSRRWRSAPWKVLLTFAMACGLALAAAGLIFMQAAVYQAFCTLCLGSACCSAAIWALALPEALATLQHVRREMRGGSSLWHALQSCDRP